MTDEQIRLYLENKLSELVVGPKVYVTCEDFRDSRESGPRVGLMLYIRQTREAGVLGFQHLLSDTFIRYSQPETLQFALDNLAGNFARHLGKLSV